MTRCTETLLLSQTSTSVNKRQLKGTEGETPFVFGLPRIRLLQLGHQRCRRYSVSHCSHTGILPNSPLTQEGLM